LCLCGFSLSIMPDWSYQTIFRPLLFRLPATAARDLCLGVMGSLARLPLGSRIIDFFGHMRPDERLCKSYLGVTFPSTVGLGTGIDTEAVALAALARFGVGFIEVGPITVEPLPATQSIELRADQQAIWYPDTPANPGLKALIQRLSRIAPLQVPVIARLGARPGAGCREITEDCRQMVERLTPYINLFNLMTADRAIEEAWGRDDWKIHIQDTLRAVQETSPSRAILLGVPLKHDTAKTDELIETAIEQGIEGVVIDGAVQARPSGVLTGLPAHESALGQVGRLRGRWGDRLFIIAAGGVHEPEQALQLLRAGADLLQVDSGLVYSGPGLPKRINDVMLFADSAPETPISQTDSATPASSMSWFWTNLLGVSMLIGGILALVIAATRVVLPYDEAFVGMTRREFLLINDRLLSFMAHDRVTLAGTMITVGVLYMRLSLFGIRQGLHWARVTVLSSAFAGFLSFFLFLGFGYFDSFHAFVTAILFQFLLLGLQSRMPPPPVPTLPNLRNNWRWRLSQWGQLLFVIHGIVLIGVGVVIALVGSTTVFVPEDLEFMQTTASALTAANPRLVPLVAHDRASLGGMLIACGLGILLPALWGYRQGERWLWWTLLAAGIPSYASAIGVHLVVGYTNLWHLAPAFAGLGIFFAALALSYPYLCQNDPAHEESWRRYIHQEHLDLKSKSEVTGAG
jgi:dihydroorotate dehydrogenase